MIREFRISAAGSCWETKDVLANKTILRSPTKRDLIYRTMEIAQKTGKAKVIIFHEDGSLDEERNIEHCQETKLNHFLSGYKIHAGPSLTELFQ